MNVQPVQCVSGSKGYRESSRLTQNALMSLIGYPNNEEAAYQKLLQLVEEGLVESTSSEDITCFRLKSPWGTNPASLLFDKKHRIVGY